MKYYPLTLITFGVIFFLSVSSLNNLPTMVVSVSDKLLHLLAYGGLSFVILFELSWNKGKPAVRDIVLFALLCPSLLGVGMEFVQGYFFPHRAFEWYDALADVAGAIIFTLLFLIARLLFSKREPLPNPLPRRGNKSESHNEERA